MGPECAVPFKVGEEALSFLHLQQGVKMPQSWKLDAALPCPIPASSIT